MYGVLIAQGFLDPKLLISPLEVNPKVSLCSAYNYSQVNSAAGRYWDESSTGVKTDLATLSNTSYAAMPLDPTARRERQWRTTGDSRFAVIGSRGTRGGVSAGSDYTDSNTTRMFKSPGWNGNICYNDNHVEYGRSLVPENLRALTQPSCPGGPGVGAGTSGSWVDNLYRNDTGCATDATQNSDVWLVLQRRAANVQPDGKSAINAWDGSVYASWD